MCPTVFYVVKLHLHCLTTKYSILIHVSSMENSAVV